MVETFFYEDLERESFFSDSVRLRFFRASFLLPRFRREKYTVKEASLKDTLPQCRFIPSRHFGAFFAWTKLFPNCEYLPR